MRALRLMLTAVEPSADALGAALVRALRERLGPDTRFVGVGGPEMAGEGIESPFDPSAMAVVGAFNAIAAYPKVRRFVRETADLARRAQPDAAILIDAWGFSIRVAHALRRVDPSLPLIKYVAPQVWATRPGRARTLARAVDKLLALHEFDAPYFEAQGLDTTVVGNPALVPRPCAPDPAAFRSELEIPPEAPLLLVLPGSREGEVRRLAPSFREAVQRLAADRRDLCVVVAVADQVADQVRARVADWSPAPIVILGAESRRAAMKAATLALACSGTVTSEVAMAGCPMVVAYRLGPFTHKAAQLLIRTPYITLFNVAAQRFIAPERVQGRCTGQILASDLAVLLDAPERRREQAKAQLAAIDLLRRGIEDPVGAAADAVVETLRRRGRLQPRVSSGM